jgi:hypothetical protein
MREVLIGPAVPGRSALAARRTAEEGRGPDRGKGAVVPEAKQWTVSIDIEEHDGKTRAVARLGAREGDAVVGVGVARLNPADRDVPVIGDELAAARALSELAHHLLDVAAADLEQAGAPARPGA